MTGSEARARIVAEARSWLGTPFHDNAGVKGAGVDCAHLVHEVFRACGLIPDLAIESYSPQFFLHHDEERFLAYVGRVAGEIPVSEAQPGDMIVYRYGRCFAHGALVIEWPKTIIHAHAASGRVVESGPFEMNLRNRAHRAFSLWAKA